jgi:intein/homing endonuclease
MNRVCNITKEQLSNFLLEGKSVRQIERDLGLLPLSLRYWIKKYELTNLMIHKKNPTLILDKIETKEWAYLIGFIAADSYINNDMVQLVLQHRDKELIDFLGNILGCNTFEDLTRNEITKKFPDVSITRKINGLSKFLGNTLKKERNLPILKNSLEKYMIQGLFDADGCITWGKRIDRGRIWQKVSFTSSYGLLLATQKILYKIGISTSIKPKTKSDCFVLEFSNKKDVLKFYDWLYQDRDFIPLKRKFDKFNALRLELGEFGETISDNAIPSRAIDHSIEGVETTGGKLVSLNNQN